LALPKTDLLMVNNYLSRLKDLGSCRLFSVVLFCLFMQSNAFTQCPQSIGCNDRIQISLDYQCFAELDPDLILEDERDACDYMVTVLSENNAILLESTVNSDGEIVYPVIDGSFVGADYRASVSFLDDNGTTISCWGWFTVEDKLPPSVTCIDDFTVDCSKDLSQILTSMNTMTYCTGSGFSDIDMNPNTISLMMTPLTGSGSAEPWEVINFVEFDVPLATMTGSGSGIIMSGGDEFSFIEDPVNADTYTGEVQGVQAFEANLGESITLVLENTAANQAAIASGVCMEFNTVSFYKFQQEDNCDPNVEVIINRDETNSIECIDGITAQRDIEYFTRDDAGLSTDLCDFSIFFERKELTEVVFPSDMDFSCSDPLILTNGQLDLSPENTGQPLLDGKEIEDEGLCRMNVTYEDDTFGICGLNTIKILRKWTVLDWCSGDYAEGYQNIKVEDDEAPSFITPQDGIVFSTGFDCKAIVDFMPLDTSSQTGVKSLSDCSDLSNLTVEVLYLPGLESDPQNFDPEYLEATNIGNNVFRASQLLGGYNTVKYILTDECGNDSEESFIILVQDDKPPVPVCDQFTAVSIGDNGWGRLFPEAIDDGSYDECGGIVTLALKKDTTFCSELPEYNNDDLEFSDFISFCCQEGGLTMGVTLRVTDESGLTNTCAVSVIVQDKTELEIESCPQLVWNFKCTEFSMIDSTDITGIPVVDGGCGNLILTYEDSGDINNLCGSGIITRKWFAEFLGNTTELVSCEQTFNFSSEVVLNTNSFEWPEDREDATCSNFASDLGDAVLYNGVPVDEAPICADLSYSFSDRIFEDVSGYCIKVIRTWTVIDFCIHDANLNPGQGIWSRNQTIKVESIEGPELTGCQQDTTFGVTTMDCGFVANFTAPNAFDLCLQQEIETSDIAYEISSNGFILSSGFGNIINDTLTVGTYVITWSAEGLCNNLSSCSFELIVEDNTPPVPYCRSGITTVITPSFNSLEDPFLEIWANDFDLGTVDNCDSDLDISFDPDDLNAKSIRFTCDDLGEQTFQVWYTDDSGNQDFCLTTMVIQANDDICPDTIGMMIAGNVKSEFNEVIQNVQVSLLKMSDETKSFYDTDINGEYLFRNRAANDNYRINVVSKDDYLNGVSTLDLVLIQRHILGLQPLNSAYQMIAADANNDQSVSATDLIELRKLILGVNTELPTNESWKYIDKSQEFVDIFNPWPLQEKIEINNLENDMMGNNFIGVKIGDVNNTFSLSAQSSLIESRSIGSIELAHEIVETDQDNEYLVPFYLEDEQSISGLQLSLILNSEENQVVDVVSGMLNISSEMFHTAGNKFNISWVGNETINAEKDNVLFYLKVLNRNSLIRNSFVLNTIDFNSEIYTDNHDILDVNLVNKKLDFHNKLYQNAPNPFSSITNIEFELSKDCEASLSIYDPSGKLVKIFKNNYSKGLNKVSVNSNELNGNGIYYYQLDTEYFSSTRKMILIE